MAYCTKDLLKKMIARLLIEHISYSNYSHLATINKCICNWCLSW